jgi:uncharacterized small protein (DUF1192 family)
MSNQNQVISVRPDTVVAVENLGSWSEYWDIKQAAEALGRSRRTVARYIDNGFLIGEKVSGPRGPEWRIVPFSVQRSSDLSNRNSVEHINEIEQLKAEIELLKNQHVQKTEERSSGHDALAFSKEISPGLLQAVAAFFMISGMRLGLTPKLTR